MCCQFSEFNVSRSDFVNWAPWLWRSMSIHVDFAPIYFPHTHQMNVISKRNVSCIFFFCFNVNKAFHWAKFVFVCLFMFRFLTLVIYSFKWCNVSLKWIYTHTKSDAAMRKRCTKRFANEKTRDKQWSGNRLFETTRIHMKVAEIDQPILCRQECKTKMDLKLIVTSWKVLYEFPMHFHCILIDSFTYIKWKPTNQHHKQSYDEYVRCVGFCVGPSMYCHGFNCMPFTCCWFFRRWRHVNCSDVLLNSNQLF